jgi:hypothetical protein
MLLGEMSAPTITALDELVADGVLQVVRAGHSVRFSHDIFFEWALYHLFVDRGDALHISGNRSPPRRVSAQRHAPKLP